MNTMDQQVVVKLSEWLEAGKQCWLCTIINTFGSSPRPIGSLLACNEDGQHCGSLSGGCVEDDLRENIFKGELANDKPERLVYGVTVEDVMRLGLPCGGILEVVVEPVSASSNALYLSLANKISKRELVSRTVNIKTGKTVLETPKEFKPLNLKGDILEHTYGPSFQLLLIGAVQVSYYLAEMAQALDYHVEICDPRAELLENSPAKNVTLVNSLPDDWLRTKTIDQHTAVIALCHDPRIDDMALMEVLHEDAFYIGAMGSAKTTEKRKERLALLDISQEQIDKLHAPVGLSIGSKTPPEIAISIMAELTQMRAKLRS